MARRPLRLDEVRRYLEPGPTVLVSSHHAGEDNLMTLGWHMMLTFEPAPWDSFDLIRKSGECIVSLPAVDQIDVVVGGR
jgi:flavin reductase (DIM6/NTAB) family NADH-FMN oxidoreductase RutF